LQQWPADEEQVLATRLNRGFVASVTLGLGLCVSCARKLPH